MIDLLLSRGIVNMNKAQLLTRNLAKAPKVPVAQLRGYASKPKGKVLTLSSINQQLVQTQYAVRGEVPILAEKLAQQLKSSPGSLPFDNVTRCNIGNPQEVGQKPLTFFRQVASLVDNPDLLDKSKRVLVSQLFPEDAIKRAEKILNECGNIGAYSHSQGHQSIRKTVAKFIEERDGYSADPESIFLSNGASSSVQTILQTLISGPQVGVMIPIPQYPLYSATLTLLNGTAVYYYLEEDNAWGLSVAELERSVKEARRNGVDVRALAVINPGNPTGQCLAEGNMREIVDFVHREKLVLLADEVYQTNTYIDNLPFHSFKKVLKSMGSAYDNVELVSFHSTSKGFVGECGKRGGYMELVGIDAEVQDQIYKAVSICLCPNTHGQILVDVMLNPPKAGEPSYELYEAERTGIYESLKRRANAMVHFFNGLEGVKCQPAQGAMYTFPRIALPKKAVEAANAAGKVPDNFYCLEMLKNTGVCVVAGSGFKQREGTWHFRSTFLPPEDQFPVFLARIGDFHKKFMDKYRD
eukprot:Colp12_sorted_trinity150504_noHs@30806